MEVTLRGPTLRFTTDALIAVCGPRTEVSLDGAPVAMHEPLEAVRGSVLAVGHVREGLRCYVAVRGGFGVPRILGSRSTHMAARLGPDLLTAGERLPIGDDSRGTPEPVQLPPIEDVVRFVPRSDIGSFEGIVSPTSDRTGLRLITDPPLRGGAEAPPDPMRFGYIQLPPDGQPIALGPDAPVTGGYRMIGIVLPSDRRILGQSRPGRRLTFHPVEADEADRMWRQAPWTGA